MDKDTSKFIDDVVQLSKDTMFPGAEDDLGIVVALIGMALPLMTIMYRDRLVGDTTVEDIAERFISIMDEHYPDPDSTNVGKKPKLGW